MAMGSRAGARRQTIATAIAAELKRQADTGTSRIDVDAMAGAVDAALDPPAPIIEGRHPEELNATNDD
ncbi:MAG: hypothetical protein MO852_06530 [Candidatus Devosia euplotis]|nr:hypothetical protein [Candidatus Devosia euplotis]